MQLFQLKVTIKDIKPGIWRRLLIPRDITFYKLHKTLQAAFGWQDNYMYDFDFNDTVVCIPGPNFAQGALYINVVELNAKKEKIDRLLFERKNCIYTYDFGANWEHELVLEDVVNEKEEMTCPICLDGARHRPPEDVEGVQGYLNFLGVQKDTKSRSFDLEYFNIDEINKALRKTKNG